MSKLIAFISFLPISLAINAQHSDTFTIKKQPANSSSRAFYKVDTAAIISIPIFNRGSSSKSDFIFDNPMFNQRQRDTFSLALAPENIQQRLYSFLPTSRSGASVKVELAFSIITSRANEDWMQQTLKLSDAAMHKISLLASGDKVVVQRLRFTAYGNSPETIDLLVPYIFYIK